MIEAIGDLVGVVLELAGPLIGFVDVAGGASRPVPGDFYRARMKLELTGHIRGEPHAAFRCGVWPSMLVRVAEEHLAVNGDILVEVRSSTHAAYLPPEFRGRATYPGYLLRIPAIILARSFNAVAPAI